jgi:hypothetical protein
MSSPNKKTGGGLTPPFPKGGEPTWVRLTLNIAHILSHVNTRLTGSQLVVY